jgi:N-acetylglucosamine-6-sulfatase
MSLCIHGTPGRDSLMTRALAVVVSGAAALAALGMSCGGQSGSKSGQDGGAGAQVTDASSTTDASGGSSAEVGASGAAGATAQAGASGAAGASMTGMGGATATAGAGGAPARPNIVFVLVDDLSMNLVQYMPHVLQMQRDGATFENYFVTDSLCCPSRTSMFTGKYPHNSGVFTNTGDDGGYATFLSHGNDPQTFAVALQGSGYRTAMLGKFLNGYDPTMNPASMGWTGWDVAGDGYPEFDYDLNQNGKIVHYAHAATDYLTDVISGLGQTFIGQKAAKPFLIELATFAPHAPYIPAPRDANLFPGLTYPRTPAFNARPTASDPAWLKAVPALKPANIANINTDFRMRAQAVQAADAMIGAVQSELVASGHDKDTYIFFASDNGYHMGERSQPPGKMTAFDTDIHVPLVVTGPGVPAGIKINQIAQNIDLCPTFAELGRTAPPATINGHSLVQLLHGETVADWRDVALIEHHDPKYDPTDPDADSGVVNNPPTYEAIRTATSVYVEYVTGEDEFHDRTTDPYELKNTAAGLSAAEVAKLHGTIAAIQSCTTAAECWTAQHMAP